MNRRNTLRACACAFALMLTGALHAQTIVTAPGVTVRPLLPGGLQNPRGLQFNPYDGLGMSLLVAEGGPGGTGSTIGRCTQMMPPIGPYTGAPTGGRVTQVYFGGVDFPRPQRHIITSNLPTSQTSVESGSLVSGVADVATIGGTLYALVGGGGCSHGLVARDNAIVRISPTGVVSLVANLSRWLRANPGRVLGPDFEPDGTWYSMVAFNGALYAIEPNHGLFVRVNPTTGAITRVLDVSAALGTHAVPTALARHKGYFYIANLGTFPIVDGTQRVWRVLSNPTRLQSVARGTAIVGLAFDPVNDNMYVLQLTSGAPGPTPGMGSLLRIRPGKAPQTVVSGLTLPTGIDVSPSGTAYISYGFAGAPSGILQVFGLR